MEIIKDLLKPILVNMMDTTSLAMGVKEMKMPLLLDNRKSDDVINVSGHRMGTAEVESALVSHTKVSEAAVVGFPHEIKGQGIYAYVTLNAGENGNEEIRKELVNWVRKEIGPIASPDLIQFAPNLPKTRSGKIMRRILRKKLQRMIILNWVIHLH